MGTRRIRYTTLTLLALLSCDRWTGCGDRPLAELVVRQGAVSRDYRGRELAWSEAPVGAEFSYGDALRTAQGSLAQVRVGKTGRVLIESETVVRFLDRTPSASPGNAGLQVTQGSALIEALDGELSLQTRAGTAVLKPGTRVELRPADQADTYRVLFGGVTFTQDDGQALAVSAGQAIAIGIGVAVLEGADNQPSPARASPQPSAATDAAAPDAALPDAAAPDAAAPAAQALAAPAPTPDAPSASSTGEASTRARDRSLQPAPPGPPHLRVTAGESFRVFDLHAPTHMVFNVRGRCRELAEARFDNGLTLRGEREIAVLAAAGAHGYELFCVEEGHPPARVTRGSFRVLQTAGARTLPKTAPHNTIELDGHRYRLMYQNLRPILSVSWSSAPSAEAYTLTLEPEAGAPKTYQTRTPEYVLPADALRDGKIVISMYAHNADHTRSQPTLVDITFDNAASTASLELPTSAGFAAGAPVEVRGSALQGTRVSIEGQAAALDKQHGFSHVLTLAPDRPAVTVRFQDTVHGIRYYVRRALAAAR